MPLVLGLVALVGAVLLLTSGITDSSFGDVISGRAGQLFRAAGAGTPTGVGAAITGAAITGTGSLAGYTNPVPGASASRIDEGGDYTLGPQGFLAPGRSKIVGTSGTFFRGGNIWGQFLDGPLAGQFWFVGEGVKPAAGIHPNAVVQAGQQVADAIASPYNGIVGNIEAGFADANGTPLAQSTGGYSEGQTTAAGVAWNNLVRGLGGIADRAETAVRGSLSGTLGKLEQGSL